MILTLLFECDSIPLSHVPSLCLEELYDDVEEPSNNAFCVWCKDSSPVSRTWMWSSLLLLFLLFITTILMFVFVSTIDQVIVDPTFYFCFFRLSERLSDVEHNADDTACKWRH